jgi:hypothetical protein
MMAAARGGRTQDCGPNEARVRVTQARSFLDVADLLLSEDNDLATPGTAAALAVLAGIAAADALCCMNIGRRARGQDHREATRLVAQVEPNGRAHSNALARLLEIKDGAHYGTVYLSATRARTAIRNATTLTEAAEEAVRRS